MVVEGIHEHSYRNVAWNGCMEDMRRQDDGCPVSNIQETSNKDADGCGWIREHSYRNVAWNGCMEDMGRQDDDVLSPISRKQVIRMKMVVDGYVNIATGR